MVPVTTCCPLSTHRAVRDDMDWVEMHRMILQLDLPMTEKNLVLVRFRRIFGHIDGHYRTVQRYYNSSRTFVITASILNPALLSIASSNPEDLVNTVLFWVVWILQMLVSLVTAYIAFFKWDKKYFVYMVYKQRAEQEIWTFLELTGRYSIIDPLIDDEVAEMCTTHRSKIKLLLSQLEMIYRKLQDADTSIQHMDSESERDGGPATNGAGGSNTSRAAALGTSTKGGIRSFAGEVQLQRKRRLEATERKLQQLSEQLATAASDDERRGVQELIQRYETMRQQNRRVDEQLLELEQNFDDKNQNKR